MNLSNWVIHNLNIAKLCNGLPWLCRLMVVHKVVTFILLRHCIHY